MIRRNDPVPLLPTGVIGHWRGASDALAGLGMLMDVPKAPAIKDF